MSWKGIERNKLDYILTDVLPVEISELFTFINLYEFLLEKDNQIILNEIVNTIRKVKYTGNSIMFKDGWSTKPLKYRIIKDYNFTREMSLIQPFSVLNLYLFIMSYQNEILNYFEKRHEFSIRYYKKNTGLFYKSKRNQIIDYFQNQKNKVGKFSIQQMGNYFKVSKFESLNSFSDSKEMRINNLKYKYYAKLDYKSCFDSIYTHSFSWLVEPNVVDAKNASNSNLYITIDRVLQNINGRVSNGIVVGPEFSRMIAEILLQHIDREIKLSLSKRNLVFNHDYIIFRYVDDIIIFANERKTIDEIIEKYRIIPEKYHLHLNELKLKIDETPCLPKEWIEKTRLLSDYIGNMFHQYKKEKYDSLPNEEKYIVKTEFINIKRIKDEITCLMKNYVDNRKTIVSFLISSLINNIGKKRLGFTLFETKNKNRAFLLIDLTLFIYSFSPSFEQTRKIISIITYINNELDFKNNYDRMKRLKDLFNSYSFIFENNSLFDLCDWFPFFYEYSLNLKTQTEDIVLKRIITCKDPVLLANYFIYSQYDNNYFELVKGKIENIVYKQIKQISDEEPMMQIEFWIVLIFFNCPFITNNQLKQKINSIISVLTKKANTIVNGKNELLPNQKVLNLICKFMKKNINSLGNGFFNWSGLKLFGDQITYRTYQRTLFKNYKKRSLLIDSSID